MYIYFNRYGEMATGIYPTSDIDEALRNGKRFELEVYDTWDERTIYDPRNEARRYN